MNNEDLVFGWDDEIEESEFEVMPDGDYWFTVSGFERGYYEARQGSKIPSCNQAEMEFKIVWKNAQGQERINKVTHKLKLCKTLQFLTYQFFECIGLIKKGSGKKAMPWNDVIDKTGICRIGHHENQNGDTFNDVVKCYPAELAPTVTVNSKPDPDAPMFTL